jgi:hypothetical protein
MRIVTFLWTRYGTDDILVRNTEGVLREPVKHLDPDGCLVQQRKHLIYEDAAKAAGGTKPIRQNRVWYMETTLLRTRVAGEYIFLTKVFLWVPIETQHKLLIYEKLHCRKLYVTKPAFSLNISVPFGEKTPRL